MEIKPIDRNTVLNYSKDIQDISLGIVKISDTYKLFEEIQSLDETAEQKFRLVNMLIGLTSGIINDLYEKASELEYIESYLDYVNGKTKNQYLTDAESFGVVSGYVLLENERLSDVQENYKRIGLI